MIDIPFDNVVAAIGAVQDTGMQLLERDTFLRELHECYARAAAGHGQLVFVGGESGIGKTSLTDRFLNEVRHEARVSEISCDGIKMPGAFGAIHDIAEALGPEIEHLIAARAPREQIFRAGLGALRSATDPVVIVGEDAHWSDEATLELIRFLGRRIGSTRTLFIINYRDDLLGPYHPLRRMLGDLITAPAVRRIDLPPLSPASVASLAAGTGIDPDELHRRTGGNPFFVTEIIGAGGTAVPPTVRDAVLARAAGLSPEARALLDAAAAIGVIVDPALLEAVIGGPIDDAVEECLAAGMLLPSDRDVVFRHGLARDTFQVAMSAPRRRALHRRILAAMEADPALAKDLAHLAHHAEEAGDAAAVQRYAVAAARHAAAFRSHREAAAQYGRALRFADAVPEASRIALMEARSEECYLTGDVDTAITVREEVVTRLRGAGDDRRLGDNLRWLSRLCWFAGRNEEARRHGAEAHRILAMLPPGPELAMALSNLSQLHMLAEEHDGAIARGDRAIALATELGDDRILAHALANVGTSRLFQGDGRGWVALERSLAIARQRGYDDDAARAITNLGWGALQLGQLDRSERYLDEGIAWTAERDLLAMELYQRATRALVWCARGALDRALREAEVIAGQSAATWLTRIVALTCIGRVRALTGEDPAESLAAARELALATGELQRIVLVQAARAEAAWLAGDLDRVQAEAAPAFQQAVTHKDPWRAGEMALWLHRAGVNVDPDTVPEVFRLEIAGDGCAAAGIWRANGSSLAAARALGASGSEADLRASLAALDAMGATADVARVGRQLRAMGARHIPRGPRPSTRATAGGLTARELEVLGLVARGCTNREIADRLYLSHKTAGHHVSAILAKLAVASRRDAVAAARSLGLLQDGEVGIPE